jgi:arsenical pump membrane protein
VATAAALAPSNAHAAASQAWPAFVLVAGLLVIGALAAEDGLFAAAGSAVARMPGGGVRLLAVLLLFEACVTAVLNLDTAVVFLTPVLLHAARRRGLDEEPFLYGAVFMANSASLLLPGSNLTNLIVLAEEHVPGHLFAARMLPAWIAAVATTIAVLALVFRGTLLRESAPDTEHAPFRLGFGAVGVALSAVLVLLLRQPAIPVFATAVGLAVVSRWSCARPSLRRTPAY